MLQALPLQPQNMIKISLPKHARIHRRGLARSGRTCIAGIGTDNVNINVAPHRDDNGIATAHRYKNLIATSNWNDDLIATSNWNAYIIAATNRDNDHISAANGNHIATANRNCVVAAHRNSVAIVERNLEMGRQTWSPPQDGEMM